MLFLIALAGIVTSAVRVVSANKWVESLRTAAEAGVEYALSQYNSAYPCPLDPGPGVASITTTVPTAYFQSGTANPGVAGISVSIKVSQLIANANWTNLQSVSSIYSPQLDPTRSMSKGFALPTATNITQTTGGGYRIIESTATNGIFSRTIRVIIKARFDMPPNGKPVTTVSSTTQNYFNSPLFSNGALSFAPSVGTLVVNGINSADSAALTTYPTPIPGGGGSQYNSYNLNVVTNTSASIGQGVTVAGDVSVLSNNSGSTPVASVPGGGTIDGRLTINGIPDTTVSATPGLQPTGANNVLANADTPPTSPPLPRQYINNTAPDALNAGLAQNQLAPVPEAVSAQPLPSLSSLGSPQNPTPVAFGSYTTEGLSTQNVSSPVVLQNSSQPISLYVNDAGSPQAVNIDTSFLAPQNTDARNLQIFYEGSNAVNVNISNGGSFTGLIYAPNAPVTISSSGGGSPTYNGGIVGGSVSVTMNGTMNLYTDLAINSASFPGSGTGSNGSWSSSDISQAFSSNSKAGLQYQLGPNGSIITGWQPVTWQEFTPAPP